MQPDGVRHALQRHIADQLEAHIGVGRTVNIAARIADYARPHEVLVSEDARRGADAADVRFELIGDVPLKGVANAVRLHRATRPS